jgi:hypothetical protein
LVKGLEKSVLLKKLEKLDQRRLDNTQGFINCLVYLKELNHKTSFEGEIHITEPKMANSKR